MSVVCSKFQTDQQGKRQTMPNTSTRMLSFECLADATRHLVLLGNRHGIFYLDDEQDPNGGERYTAPDGTKVTIVEDMRRPGYPVFMQVVNVHETLMKDVTTYIVSSNGRPTRMTSSLEEAVSYGLMDPTARIDGFAGTGLVHMSWTWCTEQSDFVSDAV